MVKEKNLIKNYIYNTLFTILNLLYPVITLPYISRILDAEGIGKVNFTNSIVNYFLMIASLGIPLYGVREIAKVRKNKSKLSQTFSEIFIINTISTIFCIILYYLMIFNIGYFNENLTLYIVCGMSIILNILNLDWFYQGIEEYRYITIRSSIVKLISIVLLALLVKRKEDYIVYAMISIIAISGNNIINFLNLRKIIKISFKSIDIKKRIKPISILLSIQVAVNIYTNLDTTMCGVLANDTVVGYYSNSVKINRIIVMLVVSVSAILLPRLSLYIENNDKQKFNELVNQVLKIILFLCLPVTLGMLFLSDEVIIILLGENFIPTISTLQIMSPLVISLSLGNLFGTQVLLPLGYEKKLLISVICGSIINFIINLILIPIFLQNGAAIATVIAETVVMLVQTAFALKYVKIAISKKDILILVISNTLLMMVLATISTVIENAVVNIIVSTITGASVYIITNIIFKNSIIEDIVPIFKRT